MTTSPLIPRLTDWHGAGSRERVESVEVGGVAWIVAEGAFRIAQS